MQRAAGLEPVVLHAQELGAGIAGVHLVEGAVALALAHLIGGDAHVVELIGDAIALEHGQISGGLEKGWRRRLNVSRPRASSRGDGLICIRPT
ncbi:hypothetical protein D9M69_613410 [compost metagenome]